MPSISIDKTVLRVPGAMITGEERLFLICSADMITERFADDVITIVNIGVMWGASMHCLRAGAPEAELIGIDIDYKTKPVHYPKLLAARMIEGDSRKIWQTCGIDNIHLLFVDGSHLVEDVKKDIKGWVPKVVVGGMIIFHDYTPLGVDLKRDPTLAGVRQAVDAMVREPLAFLPQGTTLKRVEASGSLAAFRRIK